MNPVKLLKIIFIFYFGGLLIFNCEEGSINGVPDATTLEDGNITADNDLTTDNVDNDQDEIPFDENTIEDNYPTEATGVDENHADETQFDGDGNVEPAYYVSTSGKDSNPGTFADPWRTIQHAANVMIGGDTVFIRAGTYNERVALEYKDNSAGPTITFASYHGEEAILDGTGIDIQYGEGLFQVTRTDYIRVTGLKVQNSNGAGIYIGYSNNIVIDNNRTYDTVKSGISVWGGNNVVVDGNDIAMACNAHPNYFASEENISIASSSSNVEVKNNLVHQAANIPDGYSGGEGINIKDGSHDVQVHHNVVHLDERPDGKPSNRLAFGLDGWSTETYNVSFYDNVAYHNATGFVVESEAGATAHDISVYNNIAYNNTGAGFYIPNWAQNETSLKKNIQFINNTSYNNGIGIFINSVKIENVVIRNNIFCQNSSPINVGSGVPQTQIISDHNLESGDAKYVNPSAGDFHLQAGSPAIDAGSSVDAPNTDFDGISRPQPAGGIDDIGAYEYVSRIFCLHPIADE
jgi:parallel beta-helix repeat protein